MADRHGARGGDDEQPADFQAALEALNQRYAALLDEDHAPSLQEGAGRPSFADVGALASALASLGLWLDDVSEQARRLRGFLNTAALETSDEQNGKPS